MNLPTHEEWSDMGFSVPPSLCTATKTQINLQKTWDKHEDDEFLKFSRVKNKLSSRPDLHAFLLLNKLVPDSGDMVSAAEHDEIWLSVSPAELEKVVTEEQVIELIRCGVMMRTDENSLAMFV